MSVLLVYGTRPEFIKIKPLIVEMTKRGLPFKTLFTGQHKDLTFYEATFNVELKDDGNNRLDSIVKSCMSLPNEWFAGISHVLVQGDTTSAMAMALTAMHQQIKVIHLEAGLRTYDKKNPFPEENNRRIIATLANIHLCPTENNVKNLSMEGIYQNVFVVGNTGLDNLNHLSPRVHTWCNETVLVTLHRRENHEILDQWFEAINSLSKVRPNIRFVIPLHPNPNVQKHKHLLTHVDIIEPLDHDELIKLLTEIKLVITDSGGLQEECSFLKKMCLVCRKVTERPESLGLTSYLIPTPEYLKETFRNYIYYAIPDVPCPFGDGHASEKICDIFQKLIYV
jgi:UDP-N-acetylglucosamine 2-epimerase (non-hydrolysing)